MRLRSRDLKAENHAEDAKCVACNGLSNSDEGKRNAKKRHGEGGLGSCWNWIIDCSHEASSLVKFMTGVSISALSIFSRIWQIDSPEKAVFDESVLTRYIGFYLNGSFFFESEPYFAKLILTAITYGFANGSSMVVDSDYDFGVGEEFPKNFPFLQLRLFCAFLGACLPLLIYLILLESGFPLFVALIGSIFTICENGLLTHSRFISVDSIYLFVSLCAIYTSLKYRNIRHSKIKRCLTLLCLSLFVGLTLSTKYYGVFTAIVIAINVFYDTWTTLDDRNTSGALIAGRFLCELIAILIIPGLIYVAVIYAHLSLLTSIGPHSAALSPAFQATLSGGISNLIEEQPRFIRHGSQITLRNLDFFCWLHSHTDLYPIRYGDGRGSSHQQQISCYQHKDANNWFFVKPAAGEENQTNIIRHGELIKLMHGMTGRLLNSHDVAAPLSPQMQEVSAFVDYKIGMKPQTVWRVSITNRDGIDAEWNALESEIQLIHEKSEHFLRVDGKRLPNWGYEQLQVAGDHHPDEPGSVWVVEEHRHVLKDPQEPKKSRPSFSAKFFELHKHMFSVEDQDSGHLYESYPYEWPLVDSTIAYFVDKEKNVVVHLVGNPVIYFFGSMAIPVFAIFSIFFGLRRQRLKLNSKSCHDLKTDEWNRIKISLRYFLFGYLANFVPFFFTSRSLFLFDYFPALLLKILLLAATGQQIYDFFHHFFSFRSNFFKFRMIFLILIGIFFAADVTVFYFFLPLCCANEKLSEQIIQQKYVWKKSWDGLILRMHNS